MRIKMILVAAITAVGLMAACGGGKKGGGTTTTGGGGTTGANGGTPGITKPGNGGCACALSSRGGERDPLVTLALGCVGWLVFRRRRRG